MIAYLINKFVKNNENINDRKVKKSYGYLCGIVGILSNSILSIIKIIIGLYINSIAVVADAVNNLTDVGSSVVTIVGFSISDKPADEKHPFGHARAEYLSALIIAVMIVVVGFKFFTTSIDRIRFPKQVVFSYTTFIILMLSITIKVWQAKLYEKVGKKIKSYPLQAAALDSKSDVMATAVVALSLLTSQMIEFPIDGYVGLIVSLFIIYNGGKIVLDAIDPLIGTAPDKELVQEIISKVESYDGVNGSHDLIVHSYGGGRVIATIHAEVSDKMNIVEAHEIIDRAEKEISKELYIELIMHMDPINYDDEDVKIIYKGTKKIISNIDSKLDIHDFRLVPQTDGAVLFDLVVPTNYTQQQIEETKVQIIEEIKLNFNRNDIKIVVDQEYVSL
ncbi:MAG: cation diffusion facilitator family transporter [Proteocatella sp.]